MALKTIITQNIFRSYFADKYLSFLHTVFNFLKMKTFLILLIISVMFWQILAGSQEYSAKSKYKYGPGGHKNKCGQKKDYVKNCMRAAEIDDLMICVDLKVEYDSCMKKRRAGDHDPVPFYDTVRYF